MPVVDNSAGSSACTRRQSHLSSGVCLGEDDWESRDDRLDCDNGPGLRLVHLAGPGFHKMTDLVVAAVAEVVVAVEDRVAAPWAAPASAERVQSIVEHTEPLLPAVAAGTRIVGAAAAGVAAAEVAGTQAAGEHAGHAGVGVARAVAEAATAGILVDRRSRSLRRVPSGQQWAEREPDSLQL